jgi:hypothetical protein
LVLPVFSETLKLAPPPTVAAETGTSALHQLDNDKMADTVKKIKPGRSLIFE